MPPVKKTTGAAADNGSAAPQSIQGDTADASASADASTNAPAAADESAASGDDAAPAEALVFDPSIPSVSLRAPEGATAVAIDGVQYDVGADGHVVVTERHAPVLLGLGFSY